MDNNQIETIKSYDNSANEFMQKIGKLNNYNGTYDFLINLLKENDNVLDLACGPAQISSYIKNKINVNITGVDLSKGMIKIAKENVPDGNFVCDSIITFKNSMKFNLIIIGFGIPFLNKEQTNKCIKNSVMMLEENGYFYISFMNGNKYGFEKTSFGGNNKYYIYYHEQDKIINMLE
ncbi:MAG: class I SAM-dependent methyltransferase, partial [Treponema sp.]|nr:class I SAM-dependent methyltransferase [Treponema sp.]